MASVKIGSVKALREYGRYLGIRGLRGKNKAALSEQIFFSFVFFFYLVRCPTSYERAQNTRLHRQLTRAVLHIASLAAYTTLNTYKPMEINIERSPQHWCPSRAHIFDKVHEAVNERMLGKPNLDPERAYLDASLALRSKKLTTNKTWATLHKQETNNQIPINKRTS